MPRCESDISFLPPFSSHHSPSHIGGDFVIAPQSKPILRPVPPWKKRCFPACHRRKLNPSAIINPKSLPAQCSPTKFTILPQSRLKTRSIHHPISPSRSNSLSKKQKPQTPTKPSPQPTLTSFQKIPKHHRTSTQVSLTTIRNHPLSCHRGVYSSNPQTRL